MAVRCGNSIFDYHNHSDNVLILNVREKKMVYYWLGHLLLVLSLNIIIYFGCLAVLLIDLSFQNYFPRKWNYNHENESGHFQIALKSQKQANFGEIGTPNESMLLR